MQQSLDYSNAKEKCGNAQTSCKDFSSSSFIANGHQRQWCHQEEFIRLVGFDSRGVCLRGRTGFDSNSPLTQFSPSPSALHCVLLHVCLQSTSCHFLMVKIHMEPWVKLQRSTVYILFLFLLSVVLIHFRIFFFFFFYFHSPVSGDLTFNLTSQ